MQFLEDLIREMEEKYRIELRKKAILKNECDKAYLRGVTSLSSEALKMSNTGLTEFYDGMTMQNYNGANAFSQMRGFNGGNNPGF